METEAETVERAYKSSKGLLTDKEKNIILRYYGIEKHARHSLAEIAKIYGVTRERIRQVKTDALDRIGVPRKIGKRSK